MRCNRWRLVRHGLVILCLGWAGALAHSTRAATTAEQGQAGVVVQFADGSYVARGVPFEGDSITGLDLLLQSGLSTSRSGSVVCRIESNGCNYPGEPCFCQCTGSAPGCHFWSYWQWRSESWAFSSSGAADHHVRNGEVVGWHWPGGPLTIQVSFDELADSRRIAPGVPLMITTERSLQVHVPYRGDSDGDGAMYALLRTVDDEWPAEPLPLTLADGSYHAEWTDLSAGDYELQIGVTDPAGVNGSATWTLTTTIGAGRGAAHSVFLPVVGRQN
jgi:hypothetical protein